MSNIDYINQQTMHKNNVPDEQSCLQKIVRTNGAVLGSNATRQDAGRNIAYDVQIRPRPNFTLDQKTVKHKEWHSDAIA